MGISPRCTVTPQLEEEPGCRLRAARRSWPGRTEQDARVPAAGSAPPCGAKGIQTGPPPCRPRAGGYLRGARLRPQRLPAASHQTLLPSLEMPHLQHSPFYGFWGLPVSLDSPQKVDVTEPRRLSKQHSWRPSPEATENRNATGKGQQPHPLPAALLIGQLIQPHPHASDWLVVQHPPPDP